MPSPVRQVKGGGPDKKGYPVPPSVGPLVQVTEGSRAVLDGCGRNHFHCDSALSVSKSVWHTPLLCVQWKTPDDGERNCPKLVGFYSKNKLEKLVHLVGFIIKYYSRSPEHQMQHLLLLILFLVAHNESICRRGTVGWVDWTAGLDVSKSLKMSCSFCKCNTTWWIATRTV